MRNSQGDLKLRPFEVEAEYLRDHLDDLVDTTFRDLQSQFLVLPKGQNFVEYRDFQAAYEVLKRHTSGFSNVSDETVWAALRENALSFLVLRTILGMSPPEWGELAYSETGVSTPANFVRDLDRECRTQRDRFARPLSESTRTRVDALIGTAVQYIQRGAPAGVEEAVHRLDKVDTTEGLVSLQHVASHHVPYPMLLYERYLGRPFASHRDAVSELVGDVMESAIEELLTRSGITFRKTKRAERIPGFDQAPDFFVPDEYSPAVIIEAKIAGDDGTARDKVARILRLAEMRDERRRAKRMDFEVIACIDGRGFGVRRQDMRNLILKCEGKVFTLSTLDRLLQYTRLQDFVTKHAAES